MSEQPKPGILELIRKILARTEGAGCTPAEAEAAFAKAGRLLTEHNLTMEDIVCPAGDEAMRWIEDEVYETGRWSLEDTLTYGILKTYFFVEGFLNFRNGRKVFMVFGRPDNVATARHIWSALRASYERCWTVYRVTHKRPANERRLFVAGMAKGFSDRLREERAAQVIERDLVAPAGTGTALALASIADKTTAAYKAAHPQHKPNKGRFALTKGDRSTLDAGIEAGRALNLNRALGDKGRKAIES